MVGGLEFPKHLLYPGQSALCLFCAAFNGRNDVQHLKAAGLRDVILIDNDQDKLEELAAWTNYPAYNVDAFEMIELYYSEGQHFDLVICDQWTGMEQQIHGDYIEKLVAITKCHLIMGICQTYIESQGGRPPGSYYWRSNHNGGVYWRVLSKMKL